MATTSPAVRLLHRPAHRVDLQGRERTSLARAPSAIASRDTLLEQGRDLAGLAPAQLDVLLDHDKVEVPGTGAPQLEDVGVPAVPGGADHADPATLVDLGTGRVQAVGVGGDELAERLEARRVVRVVDEHVDAVDVDVVQAARGQVVVGGEGAQPGSDVVQVRATGEARTRGRHRVGHVEPRLAAEGRRQQVGERHLHRALALAQDDRLAQLALLEDQRQSAVAAVPVDHRPGRRSGLGHREPHDLAVAAARHGRDVRVVGVEHRVPAAGDRLDDHALDVGEVIEGVDAAQARGGRRPR